nr:Flp pilus assembly protein CpaB [Arthrobacter sp. SF27]
MIAGASAIVLALVGGILVFAYTANADSRAMAGLETVNVVVVQETVPAGTPVEELAESVDIEQQPATAVPSTALADLTSSAGKVTAVELVPGEQLLAERLLAPEELQILGAVEIPKGLQEVSFQLEPQRVVGGRVIAGDHVGVYISLDAGAIEGRPEEPTTQLVLHKLLVTAVQRAPLPTTENPEQDAQALPEGSLLLTVAATDTDAARLIFAAEFGRIWLSKEPLEAKESKPEVIEKSEVYR